MIKDKWTSHDQTEFDGEPEKMTVLRPRWRTFIFDQIPFKKRLLIRNLFFVIQSVGPCHIVFLIIRGPKLLFKSDKCR